MSAKKQKDPSLTAGAAIFMGVRVARESFGYGPDQINEALAEGLALEAMLRAEAKFGATWKTADDFRRAGEEFSALLDEVRRLGLKRLDLLTAGN